MDILKKYAVDLDAEVDGIWTRLPGLDVELKIARAFNKRFKELQTELLKPYLDGIRNGQPMDEERAAEIDVELLARTILVGWRVASTKEEVLVMGDQRVPYSYEAARQLLSDPRLHDLRTDIERLSSSQARYREAGLEKTEKNLSTPLSEPSRAEEKTTRSSSGSARSSRRRANGSPSSPSP